MRLLGWIRPTPYSRLRFEVTLLGRHMQAAGPGGRQLLRECLLGIVVPNPNLDSKGDYRMRPFAAILRTMAALDGILCRDEMITGPLDLLNDLDSRAFSEMIAQLKAARTSRSLEPLLRSLSKRRRITKTTMENYTRFPLGALEWAGWTEKVRLRIYQRTGPFHRLTERGSQAVKLLQSIVDLRWEAVAQRDSRVVDAVSLLGFVAMMDRAGFDISPLHHLRVPSEQLCEKHGMSIVNRPVLFSPFQQAPEEVCRRVFTGVEDESGVVTTSTISPAADRSRSYGGKKRAATVQRIVALRSPGRRAQWSTLVTLEQQRAIAAPPPGLVAQALGQARSLCGGSCDSMADWWTREVGSYNKDLFYPLVGEMFSMLGYPCDVSRAGVNYQRWDAMIHDTTDSIPIEIKSPGEEEFISVKGVRQALENKVVMTSRASAKARLETTSLCVGYRLPNQRAEVGDLIQDIDAAFGIRIGIIDFRSLATMVVRAAVMGELPERSQLVELKGFLELEYAQE